jgi:hypothetical protein
MRPNRRDDDRPRWRCPFCGGTSGYVERSRMSGAGAIVMVLLLIFCCPLFWLGFFVTEQHDHCLDCDARLG